VSLVAVGFWSDNGYFQWGVTSPVGMSSRLVLLVDRRPRAPGAPRGAAVCVNPGMHRGGILLAALDLRFELLLSVPLLLEYEAVLKRPDQLAASKISSSEVEMILNDLVVVATPVRLAFRWRPMLPDANNDMVLETATNGGAHAIVTFNRRHFEEVSTSFGIRTTLPGEALKEIGAKRS
jgi:predicted nucleic acid-binding protein